MRRVCNSRTVVSQDVADGGTAVIERHLARYGVTRARDLPEEGKVMLYHELGRYFADQPAEKLTQLPPRVGFWRRMRQRICWWEES